MSKKIFLTPETNIIEEIKPLLVKFLKNSPEQIDKVLETCKEIKSYLRESSINSPDFSQHITRTVTCKGKTIIIAGSTKEPSIFKKFFG